MVGFHPHNQLQMSFANVLEAIRCGVDIIDATIYGIGRAAGNLPMELLVAYFESQWPERFTPLPLLNIIDRRFVRLKQESPWGYQLPYMLSGLLNVHPKYAQALMARREYTIDDISFGLKAVADRAGVGFDAQLVTDLVASGLMGNTRKSAAAKERPEPEPAPLPSQPVAYAGRHSGREFLVLANGPSLNTYSDKIGAFIEKHQPIVLGANFLGRLFVPHYHAFSNKRRFMDYIKNVHPDSSLLLGSNFEEEFIREHTDRPFEWLVFQNVLGDFDIIDGVITANCNSVSVLLCAVALVMGARCVFVAGMDGFTGLMQQDSRHFYEETDEPQQDELVLERHRQNYYYLEMINNYAEQHGQEGIHILTPTSYSKYYKGIGNYLKDGQ